MTPDQMKAARDLLGWSRTRLAAWSDTSYQTVRTFELTGRVVPLNGNGRAKPSDPVATIRATLEAAGVEFTNGDARGVRLRKQSDAK